MQIPEQTKIAKDILTNVQQYQQLNKVEDFLSRLIHQSKGLPEIPEDQKIDVILSTEDMEESYESNN